MNHLNFHLFGLLAVLLVSGCVPEQRILWSPDGSQAVVLGREDDEQTLYLCDANGTLSPKLLSHALRVAWRPDSRGLVVSRGRIFTRWTEIEPLLAPEERSELVEIGDRLYRRIQSADVDSSIEALLKPEPLTENQETILKLYLRHRHADLVVQEKEEAVEPLRAVLSVVETAEVHGHSIQMGRVIAGSALPVWGLRVSPKNLAVAYTSGSPDLDDPPLSLYVAPLDEPSPPQRIAENASMYADWSADGQYLVYAVSNTRTRDNKLQLGAVARTQLADPSGRILPEFSGRDELVGVIMNVFARVRCLPDGHIVFSANEIQLPAAANDMPALTTLFRFHPDQKLPVSRLFPRALEPHLSEWSLLFEFSPDYGHIAFPGSDNRVTVLTLATGAIQQMPGGQKEAAGPTQAASLPSWRTADELCFTRISENAARNPQVEVVICSPGRDAPLRTLSTHWPADLIESLAE